MFYFELKFTCNDIKNKNKTFKCQTRGYVCVLTCLEN